MRKELENNQTLYHSDIYMPEDFRDISLKHQKNMNRIKHSSHMLDHYANPNNKHLANRQEVEDCLRKVIKNPVKPFEVMSTDGVLTKYVIRVPYNEEKDISIAISTKYLLQGYQLVITAYNNYKTDTHSTLRKERYFPYRVGSDAR